MIFTPASTRSSATSWAAPVGTASTPTTTSSSRITLLEVVVGADGQVLVDLLPDLRRVLVEQRDDAEAVVGEDVRAGDRLAQVARAEQRDVVLAGGAQDLADLRDERVDVVADAALAELAEAGQVAADLRRVDVRVVGELLRGDRLAAHLLRLGQDLEVARQARGDAQRQPLASAVLHPGPARDGLAESSRVHSIEPLFERRPRRRRTRTPLRRPSRAPGSARRSARWRTGSSETSTSSSATSRPARTRSTDRARVLAQVAARLAVEGQRSAQMAL